MLLLFALLSVLATASTAAAALPAPTRLRVEYLENPITIDVRTPRFSWALPHAADVARGSVQSAYQLTVSAAPAVGSPTVVWDPGVVHSNRTLNIPFGGGSMMAAQIQLISDVDYSWSVAWFDALGTRSTTAHGTFTVAILDTDPSSSPDWHGAEWISSPSNGSLSTYRAEFALPAGARPARARLYMVGLGYAKTWINGNLTDTHELGQYLTFEERVLYDCVDVTDLLRGGKNVLGVMLGNGWLEPRGIKPGVPGGQPGIAPRQFLLLLSVTAPGGGGVSYFHSSTESQKFGASAPLTFTATMGPAQTFDMYKGEQYDGRVAAALKGWSTPDFTPSTTATKWVPAIPPTVGPSTWKSHVCAHHSANIIQTKEGFNPRGAPEEPIPGVYVFDFGQNMAGQVTLRVEGCPAGTIISMQHAEVLERENGPVRNSFCLRPKVWLCGLQQFANYTCSGAEAGVAETYRVMFTSMGFRYVQVTGFPGTVVRARFRQIFTLEDTIGSHACSLEALACV
jgi:alpha-L-rhamnosidase